MDYYEKKLYLARVDKDDNIIGKIERWKTHEKGILHRGFTIILYYQNQIVLQHRKHPAFDGFWDLTFSSHQIYKNEKLQTDLEAIYESLKREWNINKNDLIKKPKFLGKIYYQAKDPKSKYIEHEIDYIFSAELKNKPNPNPEFAYGYKTIDKFQISNFKFQIKFAPWVKKIINKKFI